MEIIKASGEKENFSTKKLATTMREAGASKRLINETVFLVKSKIKSNTTTEEILNIALKNLKKEPGVAERYNLKRAMMELGPTGFPFEEYIAEVLRNYGYTTTTDLSLKGKVIYQEVDIVAEKEKKFMIECKYHNEPGTDTRLQPAMYTYARFLDLSQHKFDQPWLITNTKCTVDAIGYAKGVNLKITSWNFPKDESLIKLISKKNLYPVTILFLNKEIKEKLLINKIVLLETLAEKDIKELYKRTNIPIKELEKIQNKAREILA